jgi:predicted small lipoprotein YifL
MRKITALLTMTSVLLAGCVLVPVEKPPKEKHCPPGQAKKGNCAPESDRGFCPPGQAKKGAC